MFKNIKPFLAGIIITAILFICFPGFAESTYKTIQVRLNSLTVKIDGKLMEGTNILFDDVTYIPLRKVAKMLGKVVTWDPLAQTVSIDDPKKPEGNSRLSPAKKGESITVMHNDMFNGKQILEITLDNITRGESAWNRIKKANSYNEPPAEGKEYILSKFKIKVLDTETDKPVQINHSLFDAVRKDGTVYNDIFFIAEITPNLSTDLYKGAEYEGWTYFMVDKNDTPVAAIFRNYESVVWFDISGTLE